MIRDRWRLVIQELPRESAEASVAVAEIRDATGKLILNLFENSRQIPLSPPT